MKPKTSSAWDMRRMSENKRLLNHDAMFGTTEWMHFSDDGESFTVETIQDAEPILEFAKMASKNRDGTRFKDGLDHVAFMPMTVVQRYMAEKWDQKKLRQWLNDPDNTHLRTKKGMI